MCTWGWCMLTNESACKLIQPIQHCKAVFVVPCSVTQLCPTLCDPSGWQHASLPFTVSWSFLKLMSIIKLVMPSNHLIFCHPLRFLSAIFPSIRVFSSKSALCIRWPKDCSFSFRNSPSNEYSGLIPFRIDWFDLIVAQETLKSLLQHHISKASILWQSAFIIVQLSHLHTTTGKTIALTLWTLAGKVMSLFFNALSRFAIAFLPRSKPRLLISWL